MTGVKATWWIGVFLSGWFWGLVAFKLPGCGYYVSSYALAAFAGFAGRYPCRVSLGGCMVNQCAGIAGGQLVECRRFERSQGL